MKKVKLFIAVPTTRDVLMSQVHALRDLQARYSDTIEFVYPPQFVGRIFHDHARNGMVEDFLASDADCIWFLDSDIVPHHDVLDLVSKHYDKWHLAGAPYPVFMNPKGYPCAQVVFTVYKQEQGKFYPSKIPQEGTEFVAGIATGCLFIKREVFSRLSKPYFEFKYHEESRDIAEGEDLGFCRKVNELGYEFFIDYSLVCRHFKNVDLLEVNNYAITQSNIAVMAHDRAIRSAIAEFRLNGSPKKSSLILPNY